MTETAADLANNVTKLTSSPDVAIRINEMMSDQNSGAIEIGALIEPDPALSAALLRIANSATYNRGGTVGSVAQAITVVGLREVRDLAFGICVSQSFAGIANDLITVEDFWRHSLYCATSAQSLSRKAHVCIGESLFTAGLLHDIGHLVMFSLCPEKSSTALKLSLDENEGLSPYLSERKIFGFDHMEVGAELARQWCLPDILQACIQFHHEPFAGNKPIMDAVLVVHVANSIAVLAELDSRNLDDAPPIDARAFSSLGVEPSIIAEIIAESQDSVDELLRIFIQ